MLQYTRRILRSSIAPKVIASGTRQMSTKHTNLSGIERTVDFFRRNSWAKRALITHNILALASFAFSTYNDGVTELYWFRYNHSVYDYSDEWDAIKRGCNKCWVENLCSSIFFPFTIISNVMPLIISFTETEKDK